jgi:Tol biopolymer transport system component
MTPESWAQIDQLLARALELPAAERAAFLAEACGGDKEMRRELDSLLVAHTEAEEGFLTTPALEIALGELAVEQRQSLVGTTFGQYSLLSVLGIGGMGEVYLARDERLGRQLALKMLPSQFVEDAARVERFAREARAVSALNHPNIVTVYDIGQLDGTHFIAMEHVDGQTLREKALAIPDGRLDVKEVVEIALQVSAALSAAHKAGIIHRDIKPENVMLRRDDYVKVLDFGLAKLTEPQRSLAETQGAGGDPAATNPGTVLGTLRYMSPEQAQGRDVDERSDIFSFGVVLYELLAGSPPFKGDKPAAILDAVVHHTPLPLTQLRPEVPPEFERIITRMLEKDRNLRYQSANDLRADFKRFKRELDSAPAHFLNRGGGNSGKAFSIQSAAAPRWLTAKNVAVAIVTLALIAGLGWRFWPNDKDQPSPWLNAYSSRLTDFPGEERNASLSPDGKSVFYGRRVQGQWDIFWQRIGSSIATNLTEGNDADDTQPACSPDGLSVVFRSERNGGGLFVMGASGENVRRIANFCHNPAWSPDGKHIVCGTDYFFNPKLRPAKSRVVVINVASGQERVLVKDVDAAQPRWSPGGQRIAYYRRTDANRRDIWTIAADGSDPRAVTDDTAVDWNPVWSGDGKYLYYASDRQATASLWRVRIDESTGRTLSPPEPVTGPTADVLQMDLAPDGRRIVYVTRVQEANLKAISFDPVRLIVTGDPVAITQGTRPSGSPSLSPDGAWVAFHSLGAVREDIWLTRADGSGTPTNLTNDEPIDRAPLWSPDGQRLVFFSDRTGISQIWLMNPDGSGQRQVTFSEGGGVYPFWSPDGLRIAFQPRIAASLGNEFRRQLGTQIIEVDKPWAQQTPFTLPAMNEAGDWFNGYRWSPDGKRLAGNAAGLQGQGVVSKSGVFTYSFETNQYEKVTDFGSNPEWLADSRHIIFLYAGKGNMAEQKVWLVDTQTKAVKPLLAHPTQIISTLGLTRDNCRLFFTATDHQADIFLLSLDK